MDQLIETVQIQIEEVTDNFYQQRTQEGYQALIHVIDSITEIMDIIEKNEEVSEFMDENKKLLSSLQSIIEAMTNQDTVLLADILKYDVSEILNKIMDAKL